MDSKKFLATTMSLMIRVNPYALGLFSWLVSIVGCGFEHLWLDRHHPALVEKNMPSNSPRYEPFGMVTNQPHYK